MTAVDRRRVRALGRWFAAHARDLPWRRRRTGYTALVSEAMLQQTQVSRVEERYRAFMRRFPGVKALADADEQEVLKAWEGLGYYRRARNLLAAARLIVERHGGRVPRRIEALGALPGVGRYTAGAIASIVYGERAPIVDGNVHRVLARWDARDAPAGGRDSVAWSWERAGALVDLAEDPGVLNEALMELGATVCTPRSPRCGQCPVARTCRARELGTPERFPPPKTLPGKQTVHHHAVIVVRGGRLLVERRGETGLWSNLWQTPTVEAVRSLDGGELVEAFRGRCLPILSPSRRGSFRHQTTHRDVTFHVYEARTRVRRGTWQAIEELGALPMSNAHRRVVREFASP